MAATASFVPTSPRASAAACLTRRDSSPNASRKGATALEAFMAPKA